MICVFKADSPMGDYLHIRHQCCCYCAFIALGTGVSIQQLDGPCHLRDVSGPLIYSIRRYRENFQ